MYFFSSVCASVLFYSLSRSEREMVLVKAANKEKKTMKISTGNATALA